MKILTKKAQKELLERLAANNIIAQAALLKANMEVKDYTDSLEHLIDNTTQCAILIAGIDGALTVQEWLKVKGKRFMENFEFKSAICTSVEQSKRLLELGLKKETADMYYQKLNNRWELRIGQPISYGSLLGEYFYPAWSLHRLMEIMYKGDMFGFVGLTTHNENIDTIYELVIANIAGLIKINHFSKDYLEEKK